MGVTDTIFAAEFRRNWRILVVAFVCFLFAFSAPAFSLPFLFRSVMEEFGWTREQVTLLASAKYATGAVFSILVGRFIDIEQFDGGGTLQHRVMPPVNDAHPARADLFFQ